MDVKRLAFVPLIIALAVGSLGVAPHQGETLVAKAPTLSPVPLIPSSPVPIIEETVEYVEFPTSTTNTSQIASEAVPVAGSGGLSGSVGYASPYGNCVNEPGVKRQPGNPSTWRAATGTPYIGATFLGPGNHTGVVTGIWSNGDLEVRHQNWRGGQHRFPRYSFRGFI